MLGEWYLPPGMCQVILTIKEGTISISHHALGPLRRGSPKRQHGKQIIPRTLNLLWSQIRRSEAGCDSNESRTGTGSRRSGTAPTHHRTCLLEAAPPLLVPPSIPVPATCTRHSICSTVQPLVETRKSAMTRRWQSATRFSAHIRQKGSGSPSSRATSKSPTRSNTRDRKGPSLRDP